MSGLPSAGTVGDVGWICLGLYVLWLIVSETAKTSRHARRERAETEQIRQQEQRRTDDARKAHTDG